MYNITIYLIFIIYNLFYIRNRIYIIQNYKTSRRNFLLHMRYFTDAKLHEGVQNNNNTKFAIFKLTLLYIWLL